MYTSTQNQLIMGQFNLVNELKIGIIRRHDRTDLSASLERNTLLSRKKQVKAIKKSRNSVKVRFAAEHKIMAYPNRHSEVHQEDIPNAWYQPEDYLRVKIDILNSIETLTRVFANDKRVVIDLSQHCLRGIETGISTELSQRRKQRIQKTTQSVLEQQRIQRLIGYSDPETLRAVSVRSTKEAQESAAAVAKLDSKL